MRLKEKVKPTAAARMRVEEFGRVGMEDRGKPVVAEDDHRAGEQDERHAAGRGEGEAEDADDEGGERQLVFSLEALGEPEPDRAAEWREEDDHEGVFERVDDGKPRRARKTGTQEPKPNTPIVWQNWKIEMTIVRRR